MQLRVIITCDIVDVVGSGEVDIVVKVGIIGTRHVAASTAHLAQSHRSNSDSGSSCGRNSVVQVLVMKIVKPFVGRFPHDGADPQGNVGSDQMHETETGQQSEFLHQNLRNCFNWNIRIVYISIKERMEKRKRNKPRNWRRGNAFAGRWTKPGGSGGQRRSRQRIYPPS